MNKNLNAAGNHGVLFFEPYAAAQSLKNAWTRLASTYGCMSVELTRETLTIKPHWFSRWLIGMLALDLNHEIPVAHITGVKSIGKWFAYGKVELQFSVENGESRKIMLYLKHDRKFIDAVTSCL